MDFMQYAQKAAEAVHFGNNANITGTQRSFAKLSIALMNAQNDPKDLINAAKQLELEIDKVIPKSDSPERNQHLVMKAYTHLIRSGLNTPFEPFKSNLDGAEKALKLVEPIKSTNEGIHTYMNALLNIAKMHMSAGSKEGNLDKINKALQYLHEAEETFEKFKQKFPLDFDQKALNYLQIFGSRSSETQTLSNLYHYTNIFLNNCYNKAKNGKMQLKYAVPVIRARLVIEKTAAINNEIDEIIELTFEEVQILITHHHFAQVDHILAGLMFQLVKYRRSLPDAEKPKVNNAQAKVSHLFALWALKVLAYSLTWRKDKISYEKEFPINSNVILLEELVEAGVEIYANQFPCKPLVTRDDYIKVMKKGKAWCQRALDMYDEWSADKLLAQQSMTDLRQLQQIFDNSPNLP